MISASCPKALDSMNTEDFEELLRKGSAGRGAAEGFALTNLTRPNGLVFTGRLNRTLPSNEPLSGVRPASVSSPPSHHDGASSVLIESSALRQDARTISVDKVRSSLTFEIGVSQ